MADGTGRWFFSWAWWPIALNANYERQAGFAFLLSDAGSAHVFTDTSKPGQGTQSCSSGTDPWIALNWPTVFKSGAKATLFDQTTTDLSQVWTNAGFAKPNFIQLSGAACACAATVSGSTLFPFPSTPYSVPSPLGRIFPPLVDTAGTMIQQHLSTLKKTFTTSNGLTFEVTVPPGMQAGDSGNITANFSNANNTIKGSYSWTFPSGASSANATISVNATPGQCAINYTYAGATQGSALPVRNLEYTVSITAAGNSVSKVTQKVTDGLVVSQTLSSTDVSGNTSTTTATISPDGTVELSGPNPDAARFTGVPVLSAQKLLLIDRLTNPTMNLIIGLMGSAFDPPAPFLIPPGSTGPESQETKTWNDPLWGPGTATISPQYNLSGQVQSYDYEVSLGPGPQGPISVSGEYVYSTSGDQPPTVAAFNGQFPTADGGTYTVTYSTTLSGNYLEAGYLYTLQTTFEHGDGSSVSESQIGSSDGTINQQSSSVVDAAGNLSVSTVTFDQTTGGFTLSIQTQDAAGNGTLQVIVGDSQGNVVSNPPPTPLTGNELGTGTETESGTTSGSGNDDDDDEDDDWP
jgi:hypothetical protein